MATPKSAPRPLSWAVPPEHDIIHEIPVINDDDTLPALMLKLSRYLSMVVDVPHTFEELRSSASGHSLSPLIEYLSVDVHHHAILHALLGLRGHFKELDEDDDRHLDLTRAYACEIVAWRFSSYLSEQEAIDHLLYELPERESRRKSRGDEEAQRSTVEDSRRIPSETPLKHDTSLEATERTRLLPPNRDQSSSPAMSASAFGTDDAESDFSELAASFAGLNVLEIATVTDAKKFLSQGAIQKVVNAIWCGRIIFWETLSVASTKKARKWNSNRADPYCRLRVPRYLKIYEMLFFAVLLGLYYAVLIRRNVDHVTSEEVILLVWLAAFAYDEFGQYMDAGMTFYATDFWSVWDAGIVLIGFVYLVVRVVGLFKHDHKVIDTAFDILSLEALLLVPRIASLLSLIPFFGVLIPCLKEMARYSTQFLALVLIIYGGFLTTFIMLARDAFTPRQMSYMLLKIFFGSSYLGFDTAETISPLLGLPLMLIFVWLTNILLITCLISLISNKMTQIMDHAREEYLFLYSVYVLEAATSNRLTYYFPPLNLISLLFRPLRLFMPSDNLREFRIVVLKALHAPHVVIIQAFEKLSARRAPWSGLLSGPSDSTSGPGIRRSTLTSRSPVSRSDVAKKKLRRSVGASTTFSSPSTSLKSRSKSAHRNLTFRRLANAEDDHNDRDKENEPKKDISGAQGNMTEQVLALSAEVAKLNARVEELLHQLQETQADGGKAVVDDS